MEWCKVQEISRAIRRELSSQGIQTEPYHTSANFDMTIQNGCVTKPLSFYLLDDRQYYEHYWEDSCNPVPDYVIKADFVLAMIRVEIKSSGAISLSCSDSREITPTRQGVSEIVDWLISFDAEAHIRAFNARALQQQEQLEREEKAHALAPRAVELTPEEREAARQKADDERFLKYLPYQTTSWLIGKVVTHFMPESTIDDRQERQLEDELRSRSRDNRWMDGKHKWHSGQHPYTREEIIEFAGRCGVPGPVACGRSEYAAAVAATSLPEDVLRISRITSDS